MKSSVFVIVLLSVLTFACDFGSKSATSESKAPVVLETGWYHVVDSTFTGAVKKEVDLESRYVFLDPTPGITIEHIQEAYVYSGMTSDEGVRMPLTDDGRKIWEGVTRRAERKYMGFVVDNILVITQRIPGVDRAGQTIFYKNEYAQEKIEAISKKINEDIKAARTKK